jgi:Domain of unknown function (DUF4330)
MMAVLDDRGRLFGRINLIDAAVGAFVVLLLPIAYGAFLLFRPARPTITSVDPAQITYIEERAAGGTRVEGKLKVHGTALRPTLRAMIGTQEAVGFLFETPAAADVLFGEIASGTHDLVLYDGVQEVARARNAVTVSRKPVAQMARVLAIGALITLDRATAEALKPSEAPNVSGTTRTIVALGPLEPDYRRVGFNGGAIDVRVEPLYQRQAAVLVSCELAAAQECRADGSSIGVLDRILTIPTASDPVRFLIRGIVPATPPVAATLSARFVASPQVIDRVRTGDRDLPALALDGRGATIASIERRPDVAGQLSYGFDVADRSGDRGSVESGQTSIPDRFGVADVVVRLGVDITPLGWRYRGQALRVGGTLTFTTEMYTMRGSILGLTASAVMSDGAQ